VRDYAQVKPTAWSPPRWPGALLDQEGVDEVGLDRLDRLVPHRDIEQYKGGPVGLEAIAATINDEAGDPRGGGGAFLLKIGYVGGARAGARPPRGLRAPGARVPASPGARDSSRSSRGRAYRDA